MRKIILVLALSIAIFSCSKNSDQIDIVKKDLSKKNISDNELSEFKFDVIEVFGKDAYEAMSDKFSKNKESYSNVGSYDSALKELNKLDTLIRGYKKIKDKKYYRIHTYRIAGDTVSNNIYFITDNNKIYGIK